MSTVIEEQRAVWDAVSAGWQRWQQDFENGAAAVTETLLRFGGVGPGKHVLDAGCGVGEPALTAAHAVTPGGTVIGVDLSPAMVELANARADEAGNVTFVEGDVTTVPLRPASFDVVLARWSLMFMADRVETMRALARLLRPQGVLAAAVWGPPARVPAISLAFRVISERLELGPPPAGGPGPFALCDETVVRAELTAAGFVDITVEPREAAFRFASAGQFAQFAKDVLPPRMRRLLAERRETVDNQAMWDAVAQAAERFREPDGSVVLPSACLCLRAVNR